MLFQVAGSSAGGFTEREICLPDDVVRGAVDRALGNSILGLFERNTICAVNAFDGYPFPGGERRETAFPRAGRKYLWDVVNGRKGRLGEAYKSVVRDAVLISRERFPAS